MTEGSEIEVIDPGLLTSVQDVAGRRGSQRYGVSASGALDVPAARAANALVGNAPDAAVLEVTWDGPVLRFGASATVAVTGATFDLEVDGASMASGGPTGLPAGATLSFKALRSGARGYLAVRGGIDVDVVLGSRSTDLRGGFGGFQGRALRSGDRVPIGSAPQPGEADEPLAVSVPTADAPVRILPGPHLRHFDPDVLDALCALPWVISPKADRMGYRLDGHPLAHGGVSEVPSLGLPNGAIQIPGDGRPIVLLADHQPTGGYPVPAVVIAADLRILAQRLPGDEVRFELTTEPAAVAALGPTRPVRSNGERLPDG